MRERVFGLEEEITILFFPENRGEVFSHSVNWGTHKLHSLMREGPLFPLGHESDYTRNGSRIYFDRELLEIAGPECRTPCGVARYAKANDALVVSYLACFNKEIAAGAFPAFPRGRFEVSKKSSGFFPNQASRGTHENYYVNLRLPVSLEVFPQDCYELHAYLEAVFMPFLVSRIPFVGCGNLDGNADFQVSPRALFSVPSINISAFIPGSTGDDRRYAAFARRDNEQEVDNRKYARLQVACSDSNMSSLQMEIKFGMTGIILRMVEEKFFAEPPVVLANLPDAMRVVGADHTLSQRLTLANGASATALELNACYFREATRFFSEHPMNDWEYRTMQLWEGLLKSFQQNSALYDTVIDWRILLRLLTDRVEDSFYGTWDGLRSALADKRKEVLRKAERFLAKLHVNLLHYFFLCDTRLVDGLIRNGAMDSTLLHHQTMGDAPERLIPPSDTRAYARSRIVDFFVHANRHDLISEVRWGYVTLQNHLQQTVQVVQQDPLITAMVFPDGEPVTEARLQQFLLPHQCPDCHL